MTSRTALNYVENSLKANTEDMLALGLKAALLRHSGRDKEALAVVPDIRPQLDLPVGNHGRDKEALSVVAAMRKIDPLDVRAMAEQSLLDQNAPATWRYPEATRDALASTLLLFGMLGPYPTTGLEVAADDLNAGLWQDGSSLLMEVVEERGATVQSLPASLLLSGLLRAETESFREGNHLVQSAPQRLPRIMSFPSRWR